MATRTRPVAGLAVAASMLAGAAQSAVLGWTATLD